VSRVRMIRRAWMREAWRGYGRPLRTVFQFDENAHIPILWQFEPDFCAMHDELSAALYNGSALRGVPLLRSVYYDWQIR
jgi:hypothetical protein